MKYAPPFGETDPDANYINANPAQGIDGSPVPAEAIEPPMREIVNVIEQAGLTPDEEDLTQLYQAIEVLIDAKAVVVNPGPDPEAGPSIHLATDAEVAARTGAGLVSSAQINKISNATTAKAGFAPRLATDAEAKAKTGVGLVSGAQLAQLDTVPKGLIAMWSGAATAIPTGWALCNGSNGTPNLLNRFVIAAGSTYAVGAAGGASSHTHAITIGATTLTIAQMPAHSHKIRDRTTSGSSAGYAMDSGNQAWANPTEVVGGSGSHTHSGTAAATTAANDLPPYYALCYIMKL